MTGRPIMEQVTVSRANNNQRFFSTTNDTSLEDILSTAQEWIKDLSFHHHKEWRKKTGAQIVGTFPVYVPRELISAFEMLPVSLQGGGEFLEISHAEAFLGSFICSIPKSTLELGLAENIKDFEGFISPYICDVARNLAGVFERNFPNMSSHMLHFPQNFHSKGSIRYLKSEYTRIIKKFERITGKAFDPAALQKQILISNEKRRLVREILVYRNNNPGCIPIEKLYLLLRFGSLLPDEDFVPVLSHAFTQIKLSDTRLRDFVPVLVMGPFCEQPTLEVVKLIEDVGFFVVDFDFQIGQRFITEPLPEDIDPLEALATGYVKSAAQLPTRHNPKGRAHEVHERIRQSGAEAVIFLTAKFCEPALEDFVLYKEAIEKSETPIPYLHIEFEERSSNFEAVRLQLETLYEAILFD